MKKSRELLQWHPAFYAGIQIELAGEREHLSFENEHHLGTRPKQIDVLIIKKDGDYQVQKNIGRIFRGHNIVEYKSPADSLNIDDFYRAIPSVGRGVSDRVDPCRGSGVECLSRQQELRFTQQRLRWRFCRCISVIWHAAEAS